MHQAFLPSDMEEAGGGAGVGAAGAGEEEEHGPCAVLCLALMLLVWKSWGARAFWESLGIALAPGRVPIYSVAATLCV